MSRTISRLVLIGVFALTARAGAKPKIYVAFHWHMHQPIYWPYEDVVTTADAGRWGFDLMQVHLDRSGPYTSWPADAVQSGLGFDHLGAQVSFTGSLIENLNAIESAGRGFGGWKSRWLESRAWNTSLSNPRLDLVAISYHHPVLPLIAGPDRILQIALHKLALQQAFSAPAPNGMFPPETAFAAHIIPDLVDQGISWVLVDNIHFDRARPDYPYTAASNLVPPNPAEQRNTTGEVNWVQLSNIWAPSQVSAPWGYQPHRVEYVDPRTGAASSIIVVPAARYEGNEDARGGFGAFLYEQVMSQYEAHNNDDAHPMLVVLHHDGDNYGGGTDSYYHGNFQDFISWLQANPDRFECTTIQDYLDRFPPDSADVIHVEPGSWSGADNGDPEFAKWNGDPGPDGYSPDRHSSAVITAAANRVHTAQAISPWSSLENIQNGNGTETEKAWHYLLNAETSCYWYWDGSEDGKWDSHPARAANQAVAHADLVIGDGSNDTVPPDIFLPQREPYNPGGIEWGSDTMPSDFEVWTFVYDVSGLSSVTLHARVDSDGGVDADNHIYSGGTWRNIPMAGTAIESRSDPPPTYKAQLYTATVDGVTQALVDYYVSAEDARGNIARSPLQHVYVGQAQGPAGGVGWWPNPATQQDPITVWGEKPGKLHWGVDDWTEPAQALWPAGTTAYGDGLSVESPLSGPNAQGRYTVDIGPFAGSGVEVIDFVMHYDDESWDNNNGSDYHIILLDERPDAGIDAGGGDDGGGGDDAGQQPDADTDTDTRGDDAGDKEEETAGGGCGCGFGDSGKGLLMLGIIALAFARRFRFALILVLIAVVGCQGPAEPVLDGGEDAATAGDGDGDGNGYGDPGGGGDDAGLGGDDAGSGGDDAGGGDEGPVETCGETTFSYDAGSTQVNSVLVSGSFNGWAATVGEGAWEMTADGSVWSVTRVLESGRHLYKFIVDGNWIEDPSNPDREDDGLGGYNSVLVVDCGANLEVISHSSDPSGAIDAVLRLTPAELDLDAGSVVVTLDRWPAAFSTAGNDITIHLTDVVAGIHDLRVSAASTSGLTAGPVLLKFHFGVSTDWRDAVLYFAMTDRFFNGNLQNDNPVADVDARTNYQGGDFAGIHFKIETGYFDDLGVSAIWISWPVDNLDSYEDGGRASEHRCGMDPSSMQTTPARYTAFHGYWPVHLDQTESRFGTLAELQSMVDAAHARGIRILLDFTANHVHTDSPFYQAHKYEYFNWPDHGGEHICQNVGWDTEPETCWFTSYLADLDYRKPAAVEAMVDMGVDWIIKSGADGFRLDAVKHINRAFLTRLRERLEAEVELTGIPFYLVGETFTGDAGLIQSFIGPDLIHGQFDFPANLEVLKGFATGETGLNVMDSNVRSAKATYGPDAIMSNFIGNHDIARFLSLAASDILCGVWDTVSNAAQGWLFPPNQPIAIEGYQRLRLAFTYIMTIPGVPLIYYGDEFGMPGAGDPDNRRMMRFGADLNANESSTLAFMQKLGAARAAHPALRTGTWPASLQSEADLLAYPRIHPDETAIIILNRGGSQQVLSLDVSGLGVSDGTTFTDVLSDTPTPLTVTGGTLSVTAPGQSAAVLVTQ